MRDFADINIIYGWNGTGKSTFSRLLGGLDDGRVAEFPESRYALVDSEGRTFRQGEQFPSAIRVFNEDFIKNNVNFEESISKGISVVLGERAKELVKQIEQDEESREGLQENLNEIQDKIDRIQKQINAIFHGVAKNIGLVTEGAPTRGYNRIKAEGDFDCLGDKKILSDDEYRRYQQTLQQVPLDSISRVDVGGLIGALQEEIQHSRELLQLSAHHIILKRLAEDADIAMWVEQGMALHQLLHSTICEFCRNDISPKRIEELKNHFNDEDQRLKERIDISVRSLTEYRSAIEKITIFDEMHVYSELKEEYREARHQCLERKKCLVDEIDEYIQVLKDKRQKTDVVINSEICPSGLPFAESCEELNQVIDRHNDKTQSFAMRLQESKRQLKNHLLSEVADEVNARREEKQELEEQAVVIKGTDADQSGQTIKGLEKRIEGNRQLLEQTHGGVTMLNRYITSFLGRDEIGFCSRANGESGFLITRNGKPAVHLSEGERLAVAFVYYAVTLQQDGFDVSSSILAIDDPVSSLDSNYRYQAFAFLKEIAVNCEQVFIATHDFSFLKILLSWSKNVKIVDKVNNQGKKKEKKKESSLYMLKCCQDEQGYRSSELCPLDSDLEKFETEYRFLFNILKEYRNNGSIRRAYPIPNILRKVLDTFLLNNVPICANPYKRLQKIDFDEHKKAALYKFANDESHITGGDIDPAVVAQIDEGIQSLFEMMRSVAPDQYKYLLE